MRRMYRFPCGCEWPILEDAREEGVLPLLDIDVELAPQDCPAVFALLATGQTKGVFQLESPLGRQWTKRLKPENVEHLGALSAILRPGCLNNVDEDGVSTTEHFILRKNGVEDVPPYHHAIDNALVSTYNLMVYQEQAMAIARAVAGFSEEEADALRKCVAGDTMFVSRSRGWISIDRLMEEGYANDEFLVMDENGHQQWRGIERIWSTGKKTVHSVQGRSGMRVRATQYHQFLTDTGWKARMRLREEEDSLIAARHISYDGQDIHDRSMYMVIAGMVTEGHFMPGRGTFTNHDAVFMATFMENATAVFGERPTLSSQGKVVVLKKHQIQLLRTVGLEYGLSASKHLPDFMMGATLETTREFLSFMLNAEGGVTKSTGTFEFSSTSQSLARQVQFLLLRFGIRSVLLQSKVKGGRTDTCYRLFVSDRESQLKLLAELSVHLCEEKKAELNKAVGRKAANRNTSDTIPNSVVTRFLNQYPSAGRYESGTAFTSPLSRRRFHRMASRVGDPYWLQIASGRHQYDPLKAVHSPQKEVEVFDFTVKGGDTPYIIANGLVIHNSIGKKDTAMMAKVEAMFIDGIRKSCVITEDQGKEVFAWIKSSQKYSFNLAHAMSYGLTGYDCAYLKAHDPVAFFAGWLNNARHVQDPLEEVAELVNDARLFGVVVEPPDLNNLSAHFQTDRRVITFGVGNVKGVGEAQTTKIAEAIRALEQERGKALRQMTWVEFLIWGADRISQSILSRLIQVGALRSMRVPRQVMLNDLDLWHSLTVPERDWVRQREGWQSLEEILEGVGRPRKEGGGCANRNRVEKIRSQLALLRNPPTPLADTPHWIAWVEEQLLGIAISCSKVDGCDTSAVNCSCLDYMAGRTGYIVLGVEVTHVHLTKTKKGKKPGSSMARLTITDGTCSVEAVAFPEEWKEYAHLLREGNTVILQGERDRKEGSFIVKKAWQANHLADANV